MKFISSAFFGDYRRSLYFCIIIFITTSKMKRKILLSLILCVLCSTLQDDNNPNNRCTIIHRECSDLSNSIISAFS